MKRLIVLLSLSILLSGCIMSPDAPQAAAYSIPPPGWTPQSLAGQAAVAKSNLSKAEQAAADAQSYADQVKAASMEATAQAQATTDALNLAIAQQAATATAQAQAVNATATMRADNYIATQQSIDAKVSATQTAVAIDAAIEATKQVAYERKTAFDLQAKQNQTDRDRVNTSANIMAVLFILAALVLLGLGLVLVYRIVLSLADIAQSRSDREKLVTNDRGDYVISRLPTGVIILTPAYQIAAPIEVDEPEIIDQPKAETMRDTRAAVDIDKGTDIFWINERKCRANACELLEAAINYIDKRDGNGNGQAANYLPGSSDMEWSGSKHDWYKKPIADYFVSSAGKGSVLVDDKYPTLSALLRALKRHEARVMVYTRDARGNPTPLSLSVAA